MIILHGIIGVWLQVQNTLNKTHTHVTKCYIITDNHVVGAPNTQKTHKNPCSYVKVNF